MAQMDRSIVPASVTLTASSPVLYTSGEPPFTVLTISECTTLRPIWALIHTPYRQSPLKTRDPNQNYRRIGPSTDYLCGGDSDEDLSPREHTRTYSKLVRLAPGETYVTSWTYSIVKRAKGTTHSDIWNLQADGRLYKVTMRELKWWWMFEDEMPVDCSEAKRKMILSERVVTKWKPECWVEFEFRK